MADEASPYIDLDGLKRAVGILDARYAGAGHAHGTSDIEGLTALIEGRAPLHHAHKMDEVVGLKTSLAGKADNGHVHSSLASAALEAGADLDELDLHLGSPALSLAVAPAGAAGLPDGVEGPALVACELLRWAAEDDFASRQTLADPDGGAEWQRFCASGEWTAWARTYTTASMPTPAEIGAADRVHGHVVADVEGLRAELDGKAAASHTHTVGEVESLQQTLDAKAPREHMHAMSDVTGLAGALAGKSDEGHLHEIADVVNLGSELAGKSPVTHGHDAATKVEAGFMSAADKVKLDGIADGATRVTAVSQLSNDMGYVNADQVAEAVQGGTAGMATQSWVESKGYQTAQQVSDEIDSRGYQTAQQVQAAVDAGTEDMATETWVEGLGYQTAAQVDAAVEAKGYATTSEMQDAVEQATDDMATQTWVAAKGYQDAEQVESAITAKGYQTAAQVESAIAAKGYDTAASVDGKVEDAKTELTAAIASAVSTVYRVKGSCARADLPGDPQTGDVWSLTDEDGMNVVWTGSAWDELGVPVDLTWDAITGKPSTFAPSSHTHAQADVEGLSAALAGKSDTGHGHAVADVSGLQAALDSKSDKGHGHAVADVSGLQAALDGKAPTSHAHAISQVTGLQSALDGKSDTGHGHSIANVSGLQAALDGKAASTHSHTTEQVTGLDAALAGKADAGHSHAVATAAAAGFLRQLDGSTAHYLRGDGSWAVPPNTTYGNATQSVAGLMSAADKVKLDGVATGANRYVHPAYTARTSGLYKVAVDETGHVSGVAAVTKADITALGIPGAVGEDTDTTYTLTKSGSTIKLTGSDGSETSVTDSNTTYTLSSFGVTATAAELNYTDGVTSNIQIQLNGKAAASHTHTIAQVSNLQTALDGKAATGHTHNYAGSSSAGGAATSAVKVNVTTLTSQNLNDYRTPGTFFAAGGGNTCTNKPSGVDNFGMFVIQSAGRWQTQFLYGSNDVTYTRAYHGGTWTSWVEMYTSANKPTASEIGAAAASHTHSIANVSGLQAALDGKAPSSHSHAASAITSGTLSADRLPTVPIAKGGTGATSASAARTALGITPANIGAAASSHSHPASQVTGLTASRALVSDGSGHPAVSAVTATELGYLDGVTSNVQTQLNGKAAASHSHSYLPLSGGTLTGAVTHNAKNNRYTCSGGSWISGKTAANVPIVFPTASTMDGSRYDPYMWGQNADGDVWNFGAGASNQVGFFGFNSDRTSNGSDWSVYTNITTGRLTSTSGFIGALSGNATTASTLQTARTINGTSFNGGANITTANWGTARTLTIGSTGKSVNGSGNVSWSLSEIGAAAVNHTHSGYAPVSHNHAASNITSGTLSVDRLPTVSVAKGGTGATTAAQARTNLGAAASSHNHAASNITSGTLAVARGGTGVTSDDALRQKVLNFPSSADLLDYLGL